jgi:predicted RNase H-like HicB family nuclease
MKRFNIDYTAQIWKEDDQYVAHATPLDVMSAGRTPQEAREALDEAVRLFLLTASDLGTLNQVLEECGYKKGGGRWASPAWVGIERHSTVIGP